MDGEIITLCLIIYDEKRPRLITSISQNRLTQFFGDLGNSAVTLQLCPSGHITANVKQNALGILLNGTRASPEVRLVPKALRLTSGLRYC